AQARQNLARAAVQTIAVQFLITRLHFTVALYDRIHLVHAVRINHRSFKLAEFGSHHADRASTLHDFRHGRPSAHFPDILVEIANRHAFFDGNLSFVGLFVTRNHPEQCRLSRPVGTDKADLFAAVQSGGRPDIENSMAVGLADIVDADHETEELCER